MPLLKSWSPDKFEMQFKVVDARVNLGQKTAAEAMTALIKFDEASAGVLSDTLSVREVCDPHEHPVGNELVNIVVKPAPDQFSRTTVVMITPGHAVLNRLPGPLEITADVSKEPAASSVITIDSGKWVPLYQLGQSRQIRFRPAGCDKNWSVEIMLGILVSKGSKIVQLPLKQGTISTAQKQAGAEMPTMYGIDQRLNDGINFVDIYDGDGNAPFSISNRSLPTTGCKLWFHPEGYPQEKKYVDPGQHVNYAMFDFECDDVVVGWDEWRGSTNVHKKYDLKKPGTKNSLKPLIQMAGGIKKRKTTLEAELWLDGYVKVLSFSESSVSQLRQLRDALVKDSSGNGVEVGVYYDSIGVTLISASTSVQPPEELLNITIDSPALLIFSLVVVVVVCRRRRSVLGDSCPTIDSDHPLHRAPLAV